jgi:hypothetical protein
MRFAGDVSYTITDNASIEAAVDEFKKLIVEAIPTTGDKRWELNLMFDANT